MVVFRCVKKLPELGSFFPEEYWELSQDEIEEAHQWNLSILPVVTHHLSESFQGMDVGSSR